jgi:hypothetical protein
LFKKLRVQNYKNKKLSSQLLHALFPGDRLSRPLARPGIGPRPLAANRQPFPVTNAPVTGDVTQTGDILSYLPAKLTPDDITALDNLRYPAQFIFGLLDCLGILV